jgi:hypothetical protein
MLSQNEWWMLFLVMGVLVVALKGMRGLGAGSVGADGYPYRPAGALFTPAERSFLGVLDQAVGPQYRVFGKVRVADVAEVERGLGGSDWWAAFNRISGKHFDVVVCRAGNLVPVCAIELNDRSHASRKVQQSDAFKAELCRAIGLPLLLLPARHAYSVQELRERFRAAVELTVPSERTDAAGAPVSGALVPEALVPGVPVSATPVTRSYRFETDHSDASGSDALSRHSALVGP